MKKFLKFLIIWWIISGSFILLAWRYRMNKINNKMIDVKNSVMSSEIIKSKLGNIKSVKWIKKSGKKYKDISCVTYLIKTDKTEQEVCTLAHRGISDERYRLDAIYLDGKLYEFFNSYNYNDYKEYIDNYKGEHEKIKYEDYIDIYLELHNKFNLTGSDSVDIYYDKETLSYYFKIEDWSYDKKKKEEKLDKTYNVIVSKEGIIEAVWYE